MHFIHATESGRVFLQWGGLSVRFGRCEQVRQIALELLKAVAEHCQGGWAETVFH